MLENILGSEFTQLLCLAMCILLGMIVEIFRISKTFSSWIWIAVLKGFRLIAALAVAAATLHLTVAISSDALVGSGFLVVSAMAVSFLQLQLLSREIRTGGCCSSKAGCNDPHQPTKSALMQVTMKFGKQVQSFDGICGATKFQTLLSRLELRLGAKIPGNPRLLYRGRFLVMNETMEQVRGLQPSSARRQIYFDY